jgi:histidinol dehydrogenase
MSIAEGNTARVADIAPLILRARGAFDALDADTRRAVTDRATSLEAMVRTRTAAIVDRVRARGDVALREMAREFDAIESLEIEVPRAHWERALYALDPALRQALERAHRNIATVHAAFLPQETRVSPEPGIVVGRRPDALQRVGVYAPGGRAAYPSSLLMGAVPARVAGVHEVIVCSPPGLDGLPSPVVLAAAALANVDRVFAVGGAGAIAAMAIGTDTIPRVDRIVGPGNAYVAAAKLQVVSDVTIDSPAGPSELLVLVDADGEAATDSFGDARELAAVVAREMLAQAEHDPDAAVIAVLCGGAAAVALAQAVEASLSALVDSSTRSDVVRAALAARGAIVTVPSLEQGVTVANAWAAEHLLLLVSERQRTQTLAALRSAGTIFVGASSSVAFGDYMTGANHVLPTAGAGRCYSGLSTLDFVRWTTWQEVTPDAAARLADDVGVFADAEMLPAHAAAARAWRRADRTASAVVAAEGTPDE